MNYVDKCLEFKWTEEENNNIIYLDLSIHRNNNDLHVGVHSKPTQTDTTTHFTSNHPLEHKLAAYNFYTNRMIELPIMEQVKQQEWKIILTVAKSNGFPLQIIHKLRYKIILKTKTSHTRTNTTKEKMGHLHISQSTHTQVYQFI